MYVLQSCLYEESDQKLKKDRSSSTKAHRFLDRKNLINTENPKALGKNLKGNLKEYWRYRVGNYRILADIDNDEIKVIIFNIGHRKDIYE